MITINPILLDALEKGKGTPVFTAGAPIVNLIPSHSGICSLWTLLMRSKSQASIACAPSVDLIPSHSGICSLRSEGCTGELTS